MNPIILKDLFRYEGERCHHFLVRVRYRLFVPGFRYIYFLRKCQLSDSWSRLFYKLCLKLCSYRTHIQIPWETQIGEGLYIGHWGAIIVNPNTIIGKNFSYSGSVLIGNSQGKHSGSPVIGDNVRMGQFSTVIGGVHIGNDVVIAPGAFVNFDVPDNSVVIGNPGVIHAKDISPSLPYIVYPVEEYN